MPLILSSTQLSRLRTRRLRFARRVLALTGQPYAVPHPYLRSFRLRWSSTAAPGTVCANL